MTPSIARPCQLYPKELGIIVTFVLDLADIIELQVHRSSLFMLDIPKDPTLIVLA